jgi:TonB family protein
VNEAVADVLVALRARNERGLSRVMTWSFAVHLSVAAAVILIPRAWLRPSARPPVMMISLSGSIGPRTGGTADLGGRPVEQVTPPPKRPEPIPLAAAKPNVMTIPAKTPAKPEPVKPRDTPAPPAPVAHPPTTGREITAGTSAADTGVRGQGVGLAQGGGGSNVTVDVPADFCCWDYVTLLTTRLEAMVAWKQDEHGITTLKFEVRPDGTINMAKVELEQSSGSSLLDREARTALTRLKLPPMPVEYKGEALTLHVKFPFKSP